MELPEAAEGILETELGAVKYIVNAADHVYLDAGDAYHDNNYLSINRVPYKVSLHLHLIDGVWKVKNYQDLYMSRRGSVGGRNYTDAAYSKALEVLTQAWSDFIVEHPQLMVAGEIFELTREVVRAEEEISKFQEELQGANARREIAIHRLRELGYHGPNKQDWSARF